MDFEGYIEVPRDDLIKDIRLALKQIACDAEATLNAELEQTMLKGIPRIFGRIRFSNLREVEEFFDDRYGGEKGCYRRMRLRYHESWDKGILEQALSFSAVTGNPVCYVSARTMQLIEKWVCAFG